MSPLRAARPGHASTCPTCAAPVAGDAALCAACLLRLALADADASAADTAGARPLPSRVGPFVPRAVLGEGGMGIVYLADQEQPVRRRVALKLLKPGYGPQVLKRIEIERQALASLNHPGTAQLYEAGTTDDGRPFFAMEYVAGGPITRYCDERGLPIGERLRLFQAACEAVEHAHRSGIVHRDLKPSNILVSQAGERPLVKVIDFGLAKAMRQQVQDRSLTESGAVLGTPAYMSPEQADPGTEEIGPASDVYSLGVVMYELASGRLPFDPERLRRSGYVEMARILRDEEPASLASRATPGEPLSEQIARERGNDSRSLKRLLRGELSWIVHKALAKDPARRYATAQDLADDVERFLTQRPVRARRPTLGYRLLKLARRHRASLAAAVFGLALLFGTASLVWLRRGVNEASPPTELVTRSGRADGAVISPSGRYVAYHHWVRGQQGQVWLLDLATGATQGLPDPPVAGRVIAFSRDERSAYLVGAPHAGPEALYRLALGEAPWVRLRDALPSGPELSPDESRIAGTRPDAAEARSLLVVVDLASSRERVLASRPVQDRYDHLAWSPDGKTLAASVGRAADTRRMGVVEIDVASGRERMLGERAWVHAAAKAWLPDASALLLVGRRPGGPDNILWRLERASGEARRVPLGDNTPAGWRLSLTRDGSTLALTRSWFAAALWVMPGSDSTRAREVSAALRTPAFLPDGRLLFSGPDGGLWTSAADGSGKARLPFSADNARDASATRDGRQFVLGADDAAGVTRVWRADASGGPLVPLSHAPASHSDVAPDGSYAVYVTHDARLWRVGLDGTDPRPLSADPLSCPAISRDGRFIAALETPHGIGVAQGLRVFDAHGRHERRLSLPPGAPVLQRSIRFAPDSRALDFVRWDEQGTGNVWRQPLDGGAPVQLTHFGSEPMRAFDWSWDGAWLACLRGGWRSDVVLVRGGW